MRGSLDKVTVTAEKSSDMVLLNFHTLDLSVLSNPGALSERRGSQGRGRAKEKLHTSEHLFTETPEEGQGLHIFESALRCCAAGPVLGI